MGEGVCLAGGPGGPGSVVSTAATLISAGRDTEPHITGMKPRNKQNSSPETFVVMK